MPPRQNSFGEKTIPLTKLKMHKLASSVHQKKTPLSPLDRTTLSIADT